MVPFGRRFLIAGKRRDDRSLPGSSGRKAQTSHSRASPRGHQQGTQNRQLRSADQRQRSDCGNFERRQTHVWDGDHSKAPVLTEDLRAMLRAPSNLLGIRDQALLLTGFAGAFRRSGLVALDVSDLTFGPEGLLIKIRRSKTDQEGSGRDVAIPHGTYELTCPVRVMRKWLEAAAIVEKPIFRSGHRGGIVLSGRLSGHGVGRIVKRYAKATGLTVASFSGHSLRAGFVTSAARAGEPERRIMRQPGHKSIEMVLRYVRRANAFSDNAALALGL
jgi:integrase